MIKKSFLFLLVFTIFASCGLEKKVQIIGDIEGAVNERVYLRELGRENRGSDTTKVDSRGRFSFKRKISQPTFYSVTVKDKSIALLVHPREKIVITGDADNFSSTYNIRGSKDSEDIMKLSRRLEQTVFVRDSLK